MQPGPHVSWRRSLSAVAFVFIVSRLIVFAVWSVFASVHEAPDASGGKQTMIVLDVGEIAATLRDLGTRNDAAWYEGIAENGYEQRPFDLDRQANWAFFPLQPIILRAASFLGLGDPLLAMLLASVMFFVALLFLHRIALEAGWDLGVADRAILWLALWPTSYFFCLPWSESLFLMLSTGTYLAARRHLWGWMALAGIAACASRLSGLFLLPSLVALLWPLRNELPPRAWIAVAALPLGLVAFMVYLHALTGNALAFVDIQQLWGRQLTIPYKALGIMFIKPYVLASDWNLRPLNLAVFMGGMAGCYWLARRRRLDMAIFLGLGLLAPIMTGSLTSMTRYAGSFFPLAVVGGVFMLRPQIERLVLIVFSALLALLCLAFQAGLSFAGA